MSYILCINLPQKVYLAEYIFLVLVSPIARAFGVLGEVGRVPASSLSVAGHCYFVWGMGFWWCSLRLALNSRVFLSHILSGWDSVTAPPPAQLTSLWLSGSASLSESCFVLLFYFILNKVLHISDLSQTYYVGCQGWLWSLTLPCSPPRHWGYRHIPPQPV